MQIFEKQKKAIKRFIRKKISPALVERELTIHPTTPEVRIREFMNRVSPLVTDHQLIRVGGESDGGYLLPDDMKGIHACFSPGVSDIANFELELANRDIRCFLADYSVEQAPVSNPLISFEKKFIAPREDSISMTLKNWVDNSVSATEELILQMDIEGSEYGVLLCTEDDLLQRFRIIVVEFHELQELTTLLGFELIDLVFRKLLKNFECVHIHPNNCRDPIKFRDFSIPPVMEFTFLRKDRIEHSQPAITFPHVLDKTNVAEYKDFTLPECWFVK